VDLSLAVGRLALAVCCVAILIGARWRHEQQALTTSRPLRPRFAGPANGRGARLPGAPIVHRLARPARRAPGISLSLALYWLGLTTSAALAGQALATLLAHR
jgi:hypothetical protein